MRLKELALFVPAEQLKVSLEVPLKPPLELRLGRFHCYAEKGEDEIVKQCLPGLHTMTCSPKRGCE